MLSQFFFPFVIHDSVDGLGVLHPTKISTELNADV